MLILRRGDINVSKKRLSQLEIVFQRYAITAK